MARWVIGPREELTTTVLLNDHNIKLTSNELPLCTQITTYLKHDQRSFFLHHLAINTESHN